VGSNTNNGHVTAVPVNVAAIACGLK